MGIVHSESAGDRLARGMAWPISASAITSALSARMDPEIWLSVWRSDTAKDWARRTTPADRSAPTPFLRMSYTADHVRFQVDMQKRRPSMRKPEWFGLDDPPLVSAYLYSAPSSIMRSANLTRLRSSEALADALARFPTGTITDQDWMVELVLCPAEKALRVRMSERPVRDWNLVLERTVELEA